MHRENRTNALEAKVNVSGLFVWWTEMMFLLRKFGGTVKHSVRDLGIWSNGIKELEG